MQEFIIAFICLTVGKKFVSSTQNDIPKIGIIGGGIGGTSCAFFLKSLFGENNVTIDVFEAEKIGGRLSLVNFTHNMFEEGGSIIHSRNKYMVDFLNKFGLSKRQNANGYLALYDGKDFVFSESKWQLVTLWKVIYRYGFGFWKLRDYIDDMLKKFERIYQLQNSGITYSTVGSMLTAMDPKFADYLHMTTEFGFTSQGISKIVVDEIIMATVRANYGQTLSIQKMVGSVSVAGAIGGLWSVHGGNVKVPESLLKASKANLINRVVTSVKRTSSGQIQLKTQNTSNEEEEEEYLYDVVILAAPQTYDSKHKIEFEDFEEEIKFLGRYHKTVCTVVEGNLSQSYFSNKNPIIDEILTTKAEVPFNSIGKITPVDFNPEKHQKPNVWKIFSQNKLSDEQISEWFSEMKNKYVREWLAYPHYDHSFRNDSFILAPNLYHINAIEWAASAMEMSVIGAKNVALLTYKSFLSHHSEKTDTSLPPKEELPDGKRVLTELELKQSELYDYQGYILFSTDSRRNRTMTRITIIITTPYVGFCYAVYAYCVKLKFEFKEVCGVQNDHQLSILVKTTCHKLLISAREKNLIISNSFVLKHNWHRSKGHSKYETKLLLLEKL